MYSNLFQTENQDLNRQNQNLVYLVSTPKRSHVFNTIEQVLAEIEPFVLEESLYIGEPDLLYEIPYLLDYQGYAKGKVWKVSATPSL